MGTTAYTEVHCLTYGAHATLVQLRLSQGWKLIDGNPSGPKTVLRSPPQVPQDLILPLLLALLVVVGAAMAELWWLSLSLSAFLLGVLALSPRKVEIVTREPNTNDVEGP